MICRKNRLFSGNENRLKKQQKHCLFLPQRGLCLPFFAVWMMLDGQQRIEPNQTVSAEKLQVTAVSERSLILLALPSPTTIFFALIKAKKMKPEKASLHTAVKRCFIIRRIASYGKAVLHKTPFQVKHCSTVVSQYEAFVFANMKHSAYAPYDE